MLGTQFELGTENQTPYQIHSRREILQLLEGIARQHQMITLSIRDGAEVMLTNLVKVDETRDLVYLDAPQDPAVLHKILTSSEIGVETALDRIKIMFSVPHVRECEYGGTPALCTAIPPMLIRLQRREYFRVNTPSDKKLYCEMPLPQGVQQFALADISCGGIAMMDERRLLTTRVGEQFENCRINLGDAGILLATLQIRNSMDVVLLNGKTTRRVGCQFVQQPPGMLTIVQRYIMQLERERNARVSGLF